MSMDIITDQPQAVERSTVETPVADAPAPAETDLDALLAQYDAGIKQTEPEPVAGEPNGSTQPDGLPPQDDLDSLLRGLNADTERANKLEGELNALKSEYQHAEFIRAEQEAFGKFADELQSRLPEHCPPDYARNALLSAAAVDRNLAVAWDTRGLSATERANAAAELRATEQLYHQVMRQPDSDPRKQAAIQQIVQRGQRLEMIVHGPALLRKTLREIEDRAYKHVPIDAEATALKAEIAFHMKSATGKLRPLPPPDLGKMSEAEFYNWKKENLGWV